MNKTYYIPLTTKVVLCENNAKLDAIITHNEIAYSLELFDTFKRNFAKTVKHGKIYHNYKTIKL